MNPVTTPLTVYKASAGSGKTFTLALEYIKLLILEPQNYRYILAVTFTNKATEEMKRRILSKLYDIAHALPGANDYMPALRTTFARMTDEDIRQRAGESMQLILHNYNYFRVETIDSFFQSILRNLARELGLKANLQVGLNDTEVESEAVDNIIENIQQDSDPLLTWIMDFVTEKIDKEKNWNVIGRIKDFGLSIFKEFYKTHQQDMRRIMSDPHFFKDYTSTLRKMRQQALHEMADAAEACRVMSLEHGVTDDTYAYGKKNVPGYLEKLASGNFTDPKMPNKYVTRGLEQAEEFVKKDLRHTPEAQYVIAEIAPRIARLEEMRKSHSVLINSIEITLANLNELRLLGRIEEEVNNINTANNSYPLSNTQKLLNDLIDKQDSPFIYEKIGGQLRYIMIDEFQDTSTVQWENFKVLMDDCLAHNSGSLIVGDVKQSIYRWRNGDWRLLQGLSPDSDPRIRVQVLGTNYRSKRNVIRFNNAFFTLGAKLTVDNTLAELRECAAAPELLREAAEIGEAYGDVVQQVSGNHLDESDDKAGSVVIRLLPKTDYEARVVAEVQRVVEQLLTAGIAPGKIAVLVRKNGHIQLLADHFLRNPVTVAGKQQMVSMVSDEAFRLDASLAVNTIVRAMYLLVHPDDKLVTAALVKAYRKIVEGGNEADDSSLYIDNDNLRAALPTEMLEQWNDLLTTPLIDLGERLYQIFKLSRLDGQSAYICAFFDRLSEFSQKHVAGIDEFVREWDEHICGKSIHSDEVNGIRLLTIHKSKGLEFDNVIVPFCDWSIEIEGSTLWLSPDKSPFDRLPIVPVSLYAGRLKQSIYREDYMSEHTKNLVDNLNMLYVAFTRAGHNLFVIGRSEGESYPSSLIKQVLNYRGPDPDGDHDATGAPSMLTLDHFLPGQETEVDEDKTITFRLGTLCLTEEKEAKTTENVFLQSEQGLRIPIRNYEMKATFKQSNSSSDFITPDEELEAQEKTRSYIQTGNIIHTLFASIKTIDEVDKAIDRLEFDGVLYDRPTTREQLRQMIDSRLQTPQVADWFSPRWTVYNECSIITRDERSGAVVDKRPDRVVYDGKEMKVIDFKTGREREEHHRQVRGYMRMLREMGYRQVKGYLWYIAANRVVEVNDTPAV